MPPATRSNAPWSAFTGTITPGSNGYRFGSARAGNYINLNNPNSLTGPYKLITSSGINPGDSLDGTDLSGTIGSLNGFLRISGDGKDVELVIDPTPPTLTGSAIVDDKSGGPITVGTLVTYTVTYTVTFSEAMDATTVSAADFGNAGTAATTLGMVSETAPGIFTVPVTPTSAGTLQLQVNAGAELSDAAGNALVNDPAIADDTTLTVLSAYDAWAGGAAFDADANDDGVANGMAWLLGAADPSANATGLVPVPTHQAGKLIMTFRCLKTANRGGAVLKVQYSNDLGLVDLWTSHQAVVPDVDSTVGTVFYDTSPDANPSLINVRAEIPASGSASGKLFGRLKGVVAP